MDQEWNIITGQLIRHFDVKYQYSDGTPIKNWDDKYMGLMTLRKAR